MTPRCHHMVLYASHPSRAEAVRPVWLALRPTGSFLTTDSLTDAAVSALSTPGALVVIDSDTTEPWGSLVRYLRRNAPDTPVLVFGDPPDFTDAGITPWTQLHARLAQTLSEAP